MKRGSSETVVEHVWGSFLAVARREFERSLTWPEGYFPHFTERTHWRLLPIEATSRWLLDGTYEHGNWTAGFWFGIMWLLALGTKDAEVAALARRRLKAVAVRASDDTTHDLGTGPALAGLPRIRLSHRHGSWCRPQTRVGVTALAQGSEVGRT